WRPRRLVPRACSRRPVTWRSGRTAGWNRRSRCADRVEVVADRVAGVGLDDEPGAVGGERLPGLSRVWVGRTQLPGWTDEAAGMTSSLLLRPAARWGRCWRGVSAPARTARRYPPDCAAGGWDPGGPVGVQIRAIGAVSVADTRSVVWPGCWEGD